MSTLELRAYEIFKLKFGDKEAETVMEFIEARTEKKFEEKKDLLATKSDLKSVRDEVAQLRVEMKEQKSDLIKWMFIFWIGQVAATIGIILIKH